MPKNLKRVFALIAVALIVLLIVAAAVIAVLDFPNKTSVFASLFAAMIFLPIAAWIFIWLYGIITGKKTIASFRSQEMEQTMADAERIKEILAQRESEENESSSDTQANT